MNEKFKYAFDKKTGILYKHYFGSTTLNDISSSWDYAISNNLIPKETIGFILDYREASFNIDLKKFHEIADYYKTRLDVFRDKKIAIITQNPEDVVIPSLVETKDEGYSSKPFFTVEAAVQWILG